MDEGMKGTVAELLYHLLEETGEGKVMWSKSNGCYETLFLEKYNISLGAESGDYVHIVEERLDPVMGKILALSPDVAQQIRTSIKEQNQERMRNALKTRKEEEARRKLKECIDGLGPLPARPTVGEAEEYKRGVAMCQTGQPQGRPLPPNMGPGGR